MEPIEKILDILLERARALSFDHENEQLTRVKIVIELSDLEKIIGDLKNEKNQ